MLQIAANVTFALWSIQTIIRGFRESRWRSKEWRFGAEWPEAILHSQRLLFSASMSGIGMLFGAFALSIYPNFHTLALLPVSTRDGVDILKKEARLTLYVKQVFSYVCDSVLLHVASIVRLHPLKRLISYFNFLCVILVAGFCGVVVATDYRIDKQTIPFALFGLFLESLSRTISLLYSNVQEQRQESKSFYIFERVLIGLPQLILSAVAALRYENTTDAIHRIKSWGLISSFGTILPAGLLLLVFCCGIYAPYRSPMGEELISVLEDVTPQGKTTLQATLHASYLIIAFSIFSRETTMLDWFQAVAFASIYVVGLGPVHVGYYPLRLQNWITSLIRRKPSHLNLQSWQLLGYLVTCSLIVWALLTCTSVYWINTIAYNRSAATFINPDKPNINYAYRPPRIRGMDIVIAHSSDHPQSQLFELIDRIREVREVMGMGPTVRVYTKDSTLLPNIDNKKKDENHVEELPNIGGQAGSFLHYIVTNWDKLPTQIVFLATTKSGRFNPLFKKKIKLHYSGQGFPIADAEPKSGFLSLGESQTCKCNDCSDSFGWEDTFGLIPSMWTAARPNKTCDSVLLTYSNNFIASAARIHGIPKDVWETLYNALTRPDVENSWAHDRVKLPKMFTGEERKGRWGKGGVYEVVDSKEEPIMGKTMERLWGVLLQCSLAEIAWRCPNLEVGWRVGGRREDCGCIDELAPGYA